VRAAFARDASTIAGLRRAAFLAETAWARFRAAEADHRVDWYPVANDDGFRDRAREYAEAFAVLEALLGGRSS